MQINKRENMNVSCLRAFGLAPKMGQMSKCQIFVYGGQMLVKCLFVGVAQVNSRALLRKAVKRAGPSKKG